MYLLFLVVSTCGLVLAPQSLLHKRLTTDNNSCLILSRIHFSVGTKTCISDVAHCPIPAPEAEVEAAEAAEAADVAEASMPAEAAEVPAAEVQLSSAQSKHGYVVAE